MSDLPSFARPPVAEVALGAQLAHPWISGPALGGLWDELRSAYPNHASQPPLQPIDERFDPGLVMHLQFGTPGVREVLTSADGASLVQIQADRVAYNWRKIGAGDDYPRYDTVISPFEDLLERVFARCPTPSERTVTWVEVIYVNHVATAPQEDAHRFPERILSGLATQPTLKSLLVSEDFSLTRRFLFPNNAGRLYIEASSAIGATAGQKIMLLTLTARVSVTAVRSTREALDLGHDAIVRTFADITSPEYQEEWGRER